MCFACWRIVSRVAVFQLTHCCLILAAMSGRTLFRQAWEVEEVLVAGVRMAGGARPEHRAEDRSPGQDPLDCPCALPRIMKDTEV